MTLARQGILQKNPTRGLTQDVKDSPKDYQVIYRRVCQRLTDRRKEYKTAVSRCFEPHHGLLMRPDWQIKKSIGEEDPENPSDPRLGAQDIVTLVKNATCFKESDWNHKSIVVTVQICARFAFLVRRTPVPTPIPGYLIY